MAILVPEQGYCEVEDVESRLQHPQDITDSTVPSTTQVETWITEQADSINSMLRRVGFVAPMPITRSQLAAGTQIQVQTAATVDSTSIYLKDSGGSLAGAVLRGDVLLFAGDDQRYSVVTPEGVGTDNLITVEISPPLRVALTADVNVTHTPNLSAFRALKILNARLVAALVEDALVSSGGEGENGNATRLRKLAESVWDSIEQGAFDLEGAPRRSAATANSAVRLERRG